MQLANGGAAQAASASAGEDHTAYRQLQLQRQQRQHQQQQGQHQQQQGRRRAAAGERVRAGGSKDLRYIPVRVEKGEKHGPDSPIRVETGGLTGGKGMPR